MVNGLGIFSQTSLPPVSVLEHVIDVHCHPTDSLIPSEYMESLPIRVCAMSTRNSDQSLVYDLAKSYPLKVIPCFGYHPWFTHWVAVHPFSSKEEHYRSLFLTSQPTKPEHLEAFQKLLQYLPDPTPLSDILADLRHNLTSFSNAMLGEVGLDRAARIPYATPSSPPYALEDSKRELSPFTIPLTHQLTILEAQLDLAVELSRNVSMHSVKSQQVTVELLGKMRAKHGNKWDLISVDMHSCGLSAQTWKDIQKKHSNVFLSLSTAINSRSPAHRDLIAASSPHRILVESDFHDVRYSTQQTWDMLKVIADVNGWTVEDSWWYQDSDVDMEKWGAVRRLEENWKAFERGGHVPIRKKDNKKLNLEDWVNDAGEGA